MTVQLRIKERNETVLMGSDYKEIARETLGILRILQRQIPLIICILLVALSLASAVLVVIGPRYSAEAMIRLNFTREEPADGTKTQSIATVDAVALMDSAARAIRSRATVNAAVARLGLDKDPGFAREPISW